MRRRNHHAGRAAEVIVFVSLLVFIGVTSVTQALRNNPKPQSLTFGATFSLTYAKSLGLDWRRVYLALLDELQLRALRLPVYWSETEPAEQQFAWDDLDWMVEEAAKRNVALTLAIGRKVPRWPECYIPDWVKIRSSSFERQALLDFLEQTVRRYDGAKSVARWQVENEPLYYFGDCPAPDLGLFQDELALVRHWSGKPLMLTVSGENEFWADMAVPADVLGVSLYRTTWSPIFGYSVYPFGPDYYAAKAAAVSPFVDKVIVSELQAEPWFHEPIDEEKAKDFSRQFTPEELMDNVTFARQAGFHEVFFWGVEYWYWLKEKGDPGLWTEGEKVIRL